MAVINKINIVNNVGESEEYDIETIITNIIRGYIQNQTKLSPMEQVTISSDSNNPTVAEFDGFLIVENTLTSNNGTATRHFYVNGVDLQAQSISQYAVQRSEYLTLPVNNGDDIYTPIAGYVVNAYFMYYKARDYTE